MKILGDIKGKPKASTALVFQRREKLFHKVWHSLTLLIQNIPQVITIVDQFDGVRILRHDIARFRQTTNSIQQNTALQTPHFQRIQNHGNFIRSATVDAGAIRQAQPYTFRN